MALIIHWSIKVLTIVTVTLTVTNPLITHVITFTIAIIITTITVLIDILITTFSTTTVTCCVTYRRPFTRQHSPLLHFHHSMGSSGQTEHRLATVRQ